ncbi:MAG: hypothetical protein WCK07_00630 [Betaproteobacteria bacterium]
MRKPDFFSKALAWLLIVCMVNPAMMTPAFARDTDIFLTTTSGTATAEPNILLLLDTSDSMNIPEAWTEYPGAYDSHVEYLWNDINLISDTEVTTQSTSAISTDAASAAAPESAWGFWAGADLTARRALWNAAKTYATATQSGDPGPRSTYRNYQDASWVYWLKAGTGTDNAALRSTTFNRFQAMSNSTPTTPTAPRRGNVPYPPAGPTTPYDYSVQTDATNFNACNTSLSLLTPSTVLAPSSYPRNAGVMLSQQWARHEPWLGLDGINTSGYPGSSTNNTASSGTVYRKGFLNLVAPSMPASWPDAIAGPFRDANNATLSTSAIYRPIRIRNETNSYAGWTDPKPDLGGYIFGKLVPDTSANLYPTTVLQNTLAVYGVTTQIASSWVATALLGNRDSESNFERKTGLGAYFDNTQKSLTAGSICDPVSGTRVPPAAGTNATSAYCINSTTTSAGSPGTSYTSTATQNCLFTANPKSETDLASTPLTLQAGGSCTNNGLPACSDPSGGALGCNTPPSCTLNAGAQQTFTNTTYNSCAWGTGRAQTTITPTCTWKSRTAVNVGTCTLAGRTSATVAACAWTARSAVTVNSCVKAGRQTVTLPSCTKSGRLTKTVSACAWSGRSSYFKESKGYYYYGGSCQDASGNTGACAVSGTTSLTLDVARSDVTGPYGSLSTANAAVGCGQATAAGTYYYGGTCGGSTTGCSALGGATIAGVGDNATKDSDSASCTNTGAVGQYWYGGTCTSSSGGACSFGGSTVAGVGSNATAGASDTSTCTNSPAAAGTYYTGGACTAGGVVGGATANCSTSGITASASLNGSSYTNVSAVGASNTAGCGNSTAAGTYYYGGTCTAPVGGAANCTFTGSTINVNGTNRANAVLGATDTVSCTNTAAAAVGTYMTGGTCSDSANATTYCTESGTTSKVLNGTSYTKVTGAFATNPPTVAEQAQGCSGAPMTINYGGSCVGNSTTKGTVYGTAQSTTTGLAANCSNSSATITVNGTTYTSAVTGASMAAGCSNLANSTQTCSARFGAACNDGAAACAATTTADKTGTVGTVPSGTINNFYQVYTLGSSQDKLVHDCKADETLNNPGANSYMYSKGPGSPVAASWGLGAGTSMNKTSAPFSTVSIGSSNPNAAAYTTSSSLAVTADDTKKIDVYSVNYLNWMFGPKGPNGAPIGRKTRLQIAKDALSDLVTATNGVRFGLMVFNQMASDAAGGLSEGANVASAIKRMGNGPTDLPAYNNRTTLINAINAVTATASTPLTESVYEAYRYFSGRSPQWGTATTATQLGGTVSAGYDTAAICTSNATGSGCTAVGAYASPMLNNPNTTNPAGCQKNFIILITDGGPADDWSANTAVKSLNWAGPLGAVATRNSNDANLPHTSTDQFEVSAGVPYGPVDGGSTAYDNGYIWLDELTYFMANADTSPGARTMAGDAGADSIAGRQSINTYTIGFAGANSAVLQNAAIRGNGVYYIAENSSALAAAIIAALASITDWNPTVAAATVPISALNRSENATDVYLAFFQPDPSSNWQGTVKKYQLSQYPDNGDASICGASVGLCLIGQTVLTKDAPNPSPSKNIETVVQDAITGITQSQVDDNASSFWAPSSVKDGSKPTEGGTGYQLVNNLGTLTPDTRKIYTFLTDSVALTEASANSGTTVNLTNVVNSVAFSTSTKITKCRLGDSAACSSTATMTDSQQETRINWLRGGDIGSTAACKDGLTNTACTTFRSWPHADVQHSKPAIVTYQTTGSVIQYLYYLQNNGLFTAVDSATGVEKWSFMIEETLPKIAAMIADSQGQQIDVADGTPSIYFNDANGDGTITTGGTDQVIAYFGLRRGGRVYYALDITDPLVPKFLWKIDANSATAKKCVQSGTCTSAPEFNKLGQTWSTPFIGKVRGNANPVLIFGGGYDPAEDSLPAATRTMGQGVFVVDALSATVVKSWVNGGAGVPAAMTYPIPSDVTALNTDLDATGYLDRVYVGDTGGNVWRFDINDANTANWTIKLLATLSSDISSGDKRKILFPPAVVRQNSPYRFDAVYVGTGDREHPMCLTSNQTSPSVMNNTCSTFMPNDKMFMLVDRDYGLTSDSSRAAITVGDLYSRATTDITTNTANTILNTYKGWYRNYENGEKTANSPTVFANRLRFGTYAPLGQSAGACVPAGEGRLNEIDAVTGDLVPINGTVSQASDRYYSTFITHGYISTGQLIVQGKNIFHIVVSDSRLQSVKVGSMGSATKIYWYMEPEQ